jgi:predicted porin
MSVLRTLPQLRGAFHSNMRSLSMAELRVTPAGFALAVSSCMYCADLAAQSVPPVDFYGSLRTQLETVSPDRQDRLDAYTSLRDAYSRLGMNVDHQLGAQLALTGQLELAVDSANFRLRDPYDQGDDNRPHGQRFRIARIGLRGNFGSITYGQQWMPYYNAIAAPVDMFSSYYSGYATYTVFRVANTIAYSTPEHNGFSLAAAYAGSGGNVRSTARIDDRRWQAAATYAFGNTRLAAGIDDRGDAGYGRNRLYGLSASHQADKLYLAIKVEVFDTGNRQLGAFSTDGNRSVNLFGSYAGQEYDQIDVRESGELRRLHCSSWHRSSTFERLQDVRRILSRRRNCRPLCASGRLERFRCKPWRRPCYCCRYSL